MSNSTLTKIGSPLVNNELINSFSKLTKESSEELSFGFSDFKTSSLVVVEGFVEVDKVVVIVDAGFDDLVSTVSLMRE